MFLNQEIVDDKTENLIHRATALLSFGMNLDEIRTTLREDRETRQLPEYEVYFAVMAATVLLGSDKTDEFLGSSVLR